MYTIGRLARRAKVNADSIRFYERQGLLSPANKTDSGYRLYTDDAVRRISFIKHAQRCGFSLAEIGELLHMHNGDSGARARGMRLAAEKREEVEQTMEVLQSMADALDGLLESREEEAPRGDDMSDDSAAALSAFEAGVVQQRSKEGSPARAI